MEKFGKNPWENVSTDEELANADKILKESGLDLRLAPDVEIAEPDLRDTNPAEATPAQIKVAEKFIGDTEIELAPEVEIAKPDKYDTDPTAATPKQMLGAEAILESRGSDIKLSPIAEEHDSFNKTGANFIPKIQVKPEVKPWHQPAPKESFFKRLFGG